jgi:hypothetical protein
MTETLLPRELGTSGSQTGTNIFGGDRFFSARVNNLLPPVGGAWVDAAGSGVFGVVLSSSAAGTSGSFGARAVRLLSA